MKLSALIAEYGDDLVQLQNLDQSTEALNMNKGFTKITFGTEQPISLDGTEKLGLVVWLDRERVAEIVANPAHRETATAEVERLRDALRPFAFLDEATAQEAWEIRYRDRFEDWIDFDDIERAREVYLATQGS